MEDGKPFSEVVRTAKDLGFTEPDPRDDLGGMDVARKALIIARLLGHRINLEDIEVESLYPQEMGPNTMASEKFLSDRLPLLDTDFKLRVRRAASKGREAMDWVTLSDTLIGFGFNWVALSDTCLQQNAIFSLNLVWCHSANYIVFESLIGLLYLIH
ncbi:hypothetical protein Droror1_Dr00025263 [Drosera rotundifolia]